MQLSTGPWSYNRFEAFEKTLTEGKKPDFLDVDKDGDKKESFKKAVKDKDDKKCDDCGKEDCGCDDKKSEKKDVKEQIIQSLLDDGLANNEVSAAIIAEHMSAEWQQAILDA